jgi:hypothetical protein
MQTVLWSRIEGNGLEYCEIHTQPVTTLRGRVVTQLDGKPLSVSYSVQCEDDGATQSVDLSCRIDGLYLIRSRLCHKEWFDKHIVVRGDRYGLIYDLLPARTILFLKQER